MTSLHGNAFRINDFFLLQGVHRSLLDLKKNSNPEHTVFIVSPKIVEQTVDFRMMSGAMTLMWRHGNEPLLRYQYD